MRERVGLMELSSFAKFEVEGPGARDWLDRMVANRIPGGVGRMSLAHALHPSGSVRSNSRSRGLADGPHGERFFLVGPGAAHDPDLDGLQKALPRDGSVHLTDVTGATVSWSLPVRMPERYCSGSPMPTFPTRRSPG